MSNWIDRALVRCEYSEQPVFARGDFEAEETEWRAMLATGLLAEALHAEQMKCIHCGEQLAHRAVISTDAGSQLFLNCSDCGLIPVEEGTLGRWRFCFERLGVWLHDRLALTGSVEELVPSRLWRLGRRSFDATPYTYLLARGLYRRDALALLETLKLPSRVMWLVPAQLPREPIAGRLRGSVVPLRGIFEWRQGALHCDAADLAEQFGDEPSPSPSSGRQRKRAGRAAAIELLKRQLTEHLRAARDRAHRALDLEGEPVLLPRPSQKLLAKLTGLKEVTVSRCLHDEGARELRLLWHTADDLDAVLRLPAASLR